MASSSNGAEVRYPPGLKINGILPSSSPIPGGQENAFCAHHNNNPAVIALCEQPTLVWEIQPRIRKLHLPTRSRRTTRGSVVALDGTSVLRKKLGHAAVMVASARQRVYQRKAAQQAAVYARLFNFTGEWNGAEDAL